MSTSEREKLSSFLFDGDDFEVLNVKFLRGTSKSLTADQMCGEVRLFLEGFFSSSARISKPPTGRHEQRDIAEILASH